MRKLKLFMVACALMVGAQTSWGTDWTDKTSVITNPSFETDETVSDATKSALNSATVTGWNILPTTTVSNAQAAVVNSSSTLSVLSGSDGATTGSKYFYVRQNWNNTGNFGITQTIGAANVPEGYYLLTCKIKTTSSSPGSSHWYLSIQEGSDDAVVNSNAGSAAEWLNYGVMLYKKSDATDLTISAYMVAGSSGKDQHYAMLIDDVQLKYISPSDYNGITSTNTLDMTGAIYNEGIYNATATALPRGWQQYGRSGGNGNCTEKTGDTQLEGWAGDAADFSRDYYQTINNLPSGKYTITARCHDTNARGAYAYIYSNSIRQQVTMPADYANITTPELNVTNGSVNIGIKIENKKGTWMTGDDFRMTFTNPQRVSEIATEFTNNSEMTAETWYKYTIPTDGDYTFSVTDGTIQYSLEDLAVLPSATIASTADASSVAFAGGSTLYIRSTKAQSLEISRVTPVVENGTYYLYDATNKVFLSRGANYGTRATVDKYGIPVIWSNYSKTISYLDWSDSFMFFDNNNHTACWLYTDGGSNKGDDRLFAFEETTGGYYLRDLAKAVYLTHDGSVITVPTTNVGEATVWVLKNQAEHDAIVAAYTTDNKASVIAAASLTSETDAETFETWLAANRAAKDKTSLVTMPKFTSDTSADSEAWPFTAVRNDGNINYGTDYAEAFRKSGYFAQTINGLSKGIYKVTVNAFERINGYAVCNSMGAEGWEPVTANLEANGQKTPISSWYSEKTGTNNPNGTGEAATAFNNDKYKVEVYAYVGDSGELEIKINKPSFAWDSWVLFNNITLTYYDSNVSDDDANDILTEATTQLDKHMKASLWTALSNAKTTFEDSKTVPNYNALRTAIDNTVTSVTSYTNMYDNYLSQMPSKLAITNIYDATVYENLYGKYLKAYNREDGCIDVENAEANSLSIQNIKNTGNWQQILLAPWKIGETAATTADCGFYVNWWSTESDGIGDAADFANPFFEYWTADNSVLAATTLTATQEGLTPNAAYSVTAKVRVRQTDDQTKVAGSIMMQVEGGQAVDVTAGDQIGSTPRYIKQYTATGTTDSEGKLVVTFTIAAGSNISWLSFRDINYSESDAVITNDFTTVNNTINTLKANIGFEDTEYAPYNNVEKIAALVNPFEDRYYIKSVVDAYAETISTGWTANSGEVNAIYDGDFTIQIVDGNNTKPIGWNRTSTVANTSGENTATQVRLLAIPEGVTTSNKGMLTKFHSFYGEDNGYTLPLKAATTYKFSFKYGGWSDCNNQNAHLNVYDPSGAQLTVNLPKNFSTPDKNCNTAASGWHNYEGYFTTTTAGNYVIGIVKDGGNDSQNQFGFTDFALYKAVAENITIAEDASSTPSLNYANATLTRTLSASYWNTFSVPFDMEIPAGWTVKDFDSAVDNVINFKDATTIKAGEPYLVKPDANVVNPTFNGVIVQNTEGITKGEGDYKFAAQIYNKALDTNGTIAYLSTDGKVKKLTSGGIKGLRAYFIIPASGAPARIAFLDDDDQTTGINEMKSQPVEDGNIYDLNGRRVQTMKKGIYVVNGKKIVK